MIELPRRDFLTALAAGYSATAAGYAANEVIRVGCIGAGGRCRHLLQALGKLPGVAVVGLCDVWDEALRETRKLVGEQVVTTKDYRRLLERKDVDAVLIATPDHWHVPATVAACAAGKDVYVEKPLTHDLGEGAAVVAAQNEQRRIVQVGMQQRSMTHIQEAFALVKQGKLGRIHKAHLSWNRNIGRGTSAVQVDPKTVDWKMFVGTAPDQPFNPFKMRQWRWFWDFGGGLLTDLMVHFLDVVHWFTGVDRPTRAVTIGSFVHSGGRWETPDTIQTLLLYPTAPDQPPLQVHFEGTFSNAHRRAILELMGTEGTLYLDRGRYEFTPERNGAPLTKVLGTQPKFKGADFYDLPDGEALHLANWLECIRTRQRPNAPAEAGVSAAAAAHLANQAYRSAANSS